MPAYPLTADHRELVLAALARHAGGPVRVTSEQSAGHDWAPVTRLLLDRELRGIGSSVVVKTRRVDDEGFGGPAFLRREAAALLTAASSDVAPRLVHVDDAAGVVVQSDLGVWPTLQDVLLGDDAEAASAGMIEMATTVGRLHASTLGLGPDHERALDSFGADVDAGQGYVFDSAQWDGIERACAELRLPSPRSAHEDVISLFRRAAAPGHFAALTHLDLNPTNVLITDVGGRLVDFEGSRFGHVGIDACFLHYPFPHHSNPWGTLPEDVVESADSAYRSELADGGADEVLADYDRMLADGAALAMIVRLRRLPLIGSHDQSPHDSRRRRGQVVQQIRVFSRLADRSGTLAALADWLRALDAAMVRRWPEAADPPAPLFPAFATKHFRFQP